jgi:hypothetical protein
MERSDIEVVATQLSIFLGGFLHFIDRPEVAWEEAYDREHGNFKYTTSDALMLA